MRRDLQTDFEKGRYDSSERHLTDTIKTNTKEMDAEMEAGLKRKWRMTPKERMFGVVGYFIWVLGFEMRIYEQAAYDVEREHCFKNKTSSN